jgi:hypothetical protein
MESIRTYEGDIRLCRSCGQPCYHGDTGEGLMWLHFHEQWDGIHCPTHPLAEQNPIAIKWDPSSLVDLKETYPDTYPSRV